MAVSRHRFDINPGPLKVRGAVPTEDADAGRCEAMVRDGRGRCMRDGVREIRGRLLCTQHANQAEATIRRYA